MHSFDEIQTRKLLLNRNTSQCDLLERKGSLIWHLTIKNCQLTVTFENIYFTDLEITFFWWIKKNKTLKKVKCMYDVYLSENIDKSIFFVQLIWLLNYYIELYDSYLNSLANLQWWSVRSSVVRRSTGEKYEHLENYILIYVYIYYFFK